VAKNQQGIEHIATHRPQNTGPGVQNTDIKIAGWPGTTYGDDQ
jgi:hypothetical protein